jgi:hypothetical protein
VRSGNRSTYTSAKRACRHSHGRAFTNNVAAMMLQLPSGVLLMLLCWQLWPKPSPTYSTCGRVLWKKSKMHWNSGAASRPKSIFNTVTVEKWSGMIEKGDPRCSWCCCATINALRKKEGATVSCVRKCRQVRNVPSGKTYHTVRHAAQTYR